MNIIQEFCPSGVPILIQAQVDDSGGLYPESVAVHPISTKGGVMEKLPLDMKNPDPIYMAAAFRLCAAVKLLGKKPE